MIEPMSSPFFKEAELFESSGIIFIVDCRKISGGALKLCKITKM